MADRRRPHASIPRLRPRPAAGRRARGVVLPFILFIGSFALGLGSALAPTALASTQAEDARAIEAAQNRATPDVPATALGRDGMDEGVARATARLLVAADVDAPERAWAGVLIDLAPGWHTYWRNPGDTGLPTRLEWSIDGARAGDIVWPTPDVFEEADGLFTTYGYEGRVLLQSPLDLDADAAFPGEVAVEAHLLICKQECIPADFSLRRSFDEALVNSRDGDLAAALLAEARAARPRSPEEQGLVVEALYDVSGVRPGDRASLALAVHGCLDAAGDASGCAAVGPPRDVAFLPHADVALMLEPGVVHDRGPHAFVAEWTAEALEGFEPDQALRPGEAPPRGEAPRPDREPRLGGVLRWQTAQGTAMAAEVDLPIPWQAEGSDVTSLGAHWVEAAAGAKAPSTTTRDAATTSAAGLFAAIALALLGGLILNLMPCVLPVLAIKVFAVAELADRDRRDVVAQGLAYTAGILASMGLLAAVVLSLRAAGTAVGWGFQFQSPIFIAAVAMVLVAFALNLFGTWEIRWTGGALADVGHEATGWRRSFFEGLLAVVLSTPCSAPFLGTAVGFAFASSAPVIVAIFMAIGFGLAAPFLFVTLVPGTAAVFPRSGAWMLTLRAGLGFSLLATVVWLLWIVGQTRGVDGQTGLIAALLAFAFGLWMLGVVQRAGRSGLSAAAALGVVAVALAGLNFVHVEPVPGRHGEAGAGPQFDGAGEPGGDPDSEAAGPWRAFDPAAIQATLAAGRPVFVAFSADWCITCKVNERMVLDRSDVIAELERLGFERFKADWTRRDEGIRNELARHGRAGVPLYLVYDPARPDEPTLLPEILSSDRVVQALRTAAGDVPVRASTEAADRSKSRT